MNTLRLAAAMAATILVPFASAQERPAAPVPQAADAVAKRALPTNLAVGVVNLNRAIDEYPKAIEMEKRLKAREEQASAQVEEISKRINEIVGTLDVIGKDAPDRRQKEMELQMLQMQRQIVAKGLQESFEIEQTRMQLEVHQDIEVAIAKVAKARGLHLVHIVSSDPKPTVDIAKMSDRELLARMRIFDRRTIWYAADELDVTADVIKLLLVPVEIAAPKDTDGKAATPPASGNGNGKGKE